MICGLNDFLYEVTGCVVGCWMTCIWKKKKTTWAKINVSGCGHGVSVT